MELSILESKPTMSSLEIANLTGKDHSDVLKDIRRILTEAEIGDGQFSASYKSSQNKNLPCYNLPRRECDLVVSGYSVKYRLAIIDRWQELEIAQHQLPQSFSEALLLAGKLQAEKEKLEEENKKLNTLIDNEFGYVSTIRAAIFLGISEKLLSWHKIKTITKGMGLEPKKAPSARYGYMNLYPIKAFEMAYPEYDFEGLEPESLDDKSMLILDKKHIDTPTPTK